MEVTDSDVVLVTGATGLVGSHVVERARAQGLRVRVLARPASDTRLLDSWGVDKIAGDLSDAASLREAVAGVSVIVHCAAKVGDWGPTEDYRDINVRGLEMLLTAAESGRRLRRFIHISSLGVYPARDHYGTDETEPISARGIDGYTLTKVEAEEVVHRHIADHQLPATILRPGFIYGPRDRTVLPRILDRLKSKKFAFLGSGEQLLNNTYVVNLVDAVFLALERDESIGQVYNIADGRLVTKKEFITTIATLAGLPVPTRHVPLPIAKGLAAVMESLWKLLGKKEAPLLSRARVKFLGLNLDYCIDKASRGLGYRPRFDFADAMRETIGWFRAEGLLPERGVPVVGHSPQAASPPN